MTGDPTAAGAGYEVAVVGAGPAGLAAAATAARAGCAVALLDAAPQAGGQFWRHRDDAERVWSTLAALRAELLHLSVDYTAGASVESVARDPGGFRLRLASGASVTASRLVVATGTYDRVLPFPGWDLPGVVTPGAVQALRVGAGVAIGSRVVIAGSGLALLPVAAGLIADGVEVVGVYEAGDPLHYARRPGVVAAAKLYRTAGYAALLARHRVRYRTRHVVLAARGAPAVSSVEVARLDRHRRVVPRTRRVVSCDALAVGYGSTPRLELPLALGCETRLDVDGTLVLMVDVAGRTSVPGVYAAGEVTGVGDSALALTDGELVGAVVALAAGRTSPFTERELTRMLDVRSGQRRFARQAHEAHAPPLGWVSRVDDATVVCRCREVTAGQVAAAVAGGATEARAVRERSHAGTGGCQGRICGYAVAALTAYRCHRPITATDLATFAAGPDSGHGDRVEQRQGAAPVTPADPDPAG